MNPKIGADISVTFIFKTYIYENSNCTLSELILLSFSINFLLISLINQLSGIFRESSMKYEY